MNSLCTPVAIPLHRPLLSRWADQLWCGLRSLRLPKPSPDVAELYRRDLELLESLSAHTLRDIGASEQVQARAAARREAEQARLLQWLGRAHDADALRW
jgi:hypothetical protein